MAVVGVHVTTSQRFEIAVYSDGRFDRVTKEVGCFRKAGVMAWGDELEQLTTKAYETFGWGAFQAALARALAATITHKMEPIEVAAESNQLAAWMVDNGMTNGSIAPTSALYEALRTELRQLMREH